MGTNLHHMIQLEYYAELVIMYNINVIIRQTKRLCGLIIVQTRGLNLLRLTASSQLKQERFESFAPIFRASDNRFSHLNRHRLTHTHNRNKQSTKTVSRNHTVTVNSSLLIIYVVFTCALSMIV